MERNSTNVNHLPLASATLEATFVLELDGRISHPSEALLQLVGYQAGADLTHLSDLITDPLEAKQVLDWLDQCTGFCALQWPTSFCSSQGNKVAVELLASAVRTGSRMQAYCAVKARHLGKAHAKEGERQAPSQHIVDMWQDAPCGYHSLDARGNIVEINRTELAWLGRSLEEVLHRPIADFYTPHSRERFKELFPVFLQEGHLEGLEYELVSSDGSIRHVSVSASAMRDDAGMYQGSRTVLYDISELVHARARHAELLANQESMLQALRANQAALLENEFRWKFAVEGAGEGVWDWNLATGETTFSPRWREIHGYTEDEVLPSHEELRRCIHPEDVDGAMVEIGAFLEGSKLSYNMEFRFRGKHGSYIWIQSRGAAVTRDSAGQPLRVIGTHRDMDQQVKARMLLEQSEERLRAITDNTSSVMFLKDVDGCYLHVNKTFEKLFKVTLDTVLGKTDFDFFPHEMAMNFRRIDQWVIATGQNFEGEEEALLEDGIHSYLSVKVPVRDPQGNIYAVCGMATDITERKRMENEIRIAGVAFESPFCMVVTDANQVIQRVNKAFEESTGFSAEYAVGRTPHFLRAGRHDDSFYADMWRSIRETGSWQGEIWGRRKNKEFYLKWLTISTVRNEAGEVTHYVSSDSDISERKRAEVAQLQLNRELAEKKVQLRELVAQNEMVRERERKHIAREVHDELGQVLTALRMDTSFIAMRFGNLDPALNTKVLGMRALVDNAIQGVRNVASNLRPIALDMGLYLALDWLCQDFVERTGVVCVLDAEDQNVVLDESRSVVVFRIVQESLTNISRYAHASRVRVGMGMNGDELGVDIQDNGIGFDPQATGKTKTFGLLGMKERALVLGGRLVVVSAPGQGTTVGLSIPMERRMEGAAR